MNITEFAESHNVGYEAVRIYIKRHNLEVVKDSTGETILPDKTIEILEKKYKLPEPVQIIEDTETLKKLEEAQRKIIELQDRLIQQHDRLEEADKAQMRLEMQQETIDGLKSENMHKDEKLKDAENQINDLKTQVDSAREEVERLKSRSLWQRIRNKD